MSLDTNLYVGPYFECVPRKNETRETEEVGCINPACEGHPSRQRYYGYGNHCSYCGSPRAAVSITVPDYPDPIDLTEEALRSILSDGACDRDGACLLAPNVTREGEPLRHTDESEVHLDLSAVDREAEMAWLGSAFAPELAKLLGAYLTVAIKWGVHVYVT